MAGRRVLTVAAVPSSLARVEESKGYPRAIVPPQSPTNPQEKALLSSGALLHRAVLQRHSLAGSEARGEQELPRRPSTGSSSAHEDQQWRGLQPPQPGTSPGFRQAEDTAEYLAAAVPPLRLHSRADFHHHLNSRRPAPPGISSPLLAPRTTATATGDLPKLRAPPLRMSEAGRKRIRKTRHRAYTMCQELLPEDWEGDVCQLCLPSPAQPSTQMDLIAFLGWFK
ncbi:uncharacterized protein LOC130275651 [Hyla sarda]|uniref:uncharacterized protein LOC130275651 n=1 Tax=Hyla sarda TaxID=327740 RepID=UPI0024C2E20F|nr:uncharacterized protein LOC130275651 [Hyla sarda]